MDGLESWKRQNRTRRISFNKRKKGSLIASGNWYDIQGLVESLLRVGIEVTEVEKEVNGKWKQFRDVNF